MVGTDSTETARARAALAALADLTPAASRPDEALSVPLEWFRWLDEGMRLIVSDRLSDPGLAPGPLEAWNAKREPTIPPPTLRLERSFGERLAAVQQLRAGRHAIRLGWLWLAGTTVIVSSGGKEVRRRVFQPVVSRTVRVIRSSGRLGWELIAYGDPEITPLVDDRATAQRLEARVTIGGQAFRSLNQLTPALLKRLTYLTRFARECAAAAGFPTAPLVLDRSQPEECMRHDGVRVVVGLAIYTTDEPQRTSRAGALLAWPDSSLSQRTAFNAVYAEADTPSAYTGPVESPLPLTERQTETLRLARNQPLTVVSGAPGTGKSHTLVAIVCDALRHGESVLVAAKSDAAVDALIDLLGRQPGITPVVFGSSERRIRLAQRLADGELRPADAGKLRQAEAAWHQAVAAREAAREAARRSLQAEWRLTPAGQATTVAARAIAPHAFAGPVADLEALVARCSGPAGGWWSRWRRRAAERALRRRVGAPGDAAMDEVVSAARLAIADRCDPGDDVPAPSDACARLDDAEQEARRRLTAWLALDTRSERRLDRAGLSAVATLATALRSGRGARRVQLERLRDDALVRALPVWMGTLGDVDDLLPPVPGLFDLVLIDEASATEQTAAASSLLRARRAVIVGDPRQLRHISFLSDDTIAEALERHGVLPEARSQLDVRRNSLFDAAAAASPVVVLDEHFRSAPHLIDVVARTLYGGMLHVATRTPLTESLDCVHLLATTGTRGPDGTVRSEIDAIVAALRGRRASRESIGVVTPFRAQADALEAAILASFTTDELLRLGVRVGTVHAFQGNERDVVLCSLGLADAERAGCSFVADPHLQAVMLTRARRSMTVVSSCRPEPSSLLGQYLAAADAPPGAPPPAAPLSPWAEAVLADLRLAGLQVLAAYASGRNIVDGAAANGHQPVAIVCDLHPDGVEAHIDRHLALIRAGWATVDAMRSHWDGRRPELVVDLAHRLRPGTEPPPRKG